MCTRMRSLCILAFWLFSLFSRHISRTKSFQRNCYVNFLALHRYHRAATRAVMAGHHLEYLNAASVPQGLQLTLSPQVYAADTSSVDSKISEILATAQSNVISALCKHYSSLQATSTTKKQTVLAKMSSLPPLPHRD